MELLEQNYSRSANGANEATKATNGAITLKDGDGKPNSQDKAKTADTKKNAAVKPVLNLDSTLKILKDLHRESIKRENLIDRINKLEQFEIGLMDEADEIEDNIFAGCKLVIMDNENRQFVTNTPGLIKMVAEFVKKACHDKLAEIEANIVFPAVA